MELFKNMFKKTIFPEKSEIKEITDRIENLNNKNIIDYSGIMILI